MSNTNITQTIKAKLDELDLDRRLEEVVAQAEQAFGKALDAAGDYTSTRRDDIEKFLDNAAAKINERTDSKYADHVARVHTQVANGVTKLAERPRGAATTDDGEPPVA